MDRIEKLKEFLAQNPEDAFTQHALALEYVKRGDDEEARRLFENLLFKNSDYTGSYYHLAKLLERQDDRESARLWYEKGMVVAREQGDNHAYNELRTAYDELMDY